MTKAGKEKISRPPARLGSLLDNVLGDLGLARNLGGWRVATSWEQIVGKRIAKASQAIRFEDDTLLVSVPDAVWRQQLSLEVDAILKKIHSFPGGRVIKKIHFVS